MDVLEKTKRKLESVVNSGCSTQWSLQSHVLWPILCRVIFFLCLCFLETTCAQTRWQTRTVGLVLGLRIATLVTSATQRRSATLLGSRPPKR